MIVSVIVGVGVVGTMQLLAVGSQSNVQGAEVSTAIGLASNIRELSLGMAFLDPEQPTVWSTKETSLSAYDDVLDLDGCNFSPPVDARRQSLTSYANWKQSISVATVQLTNLATTRPSTTTEPSARVTVRILHNNKEVYQTSWVAVSPS